MKVDIQKNGVLRITAEGETEVFALQEWEKMAKSLAHHTNAYSTKSIMIVQKKEND